MTTRTTLLAGCLFAGLAVALGAFGAHALKDLLETTNRADTFELAVRYQFYHAFALLITGVLLQHHNTKSLQYAATCFALGIIFFSGSLYFLCFTGVRMMGAVTPIGGVFFIIGWILLGSGLLKSQHKNVGDIKK
jgi:uncharacterized membrane protein YgdD (TMEM256/DUF423 family)